MNTPDVADQLRARDLLPLVVEVCKRRGVTLDEVCEAVGRLHDKLREGGLDAGGRARLAALCWVLGLDGHADRVSS